MAQTPAPVGGPERLFRTGRDMAERRSRGTISEPHSRLSSGKVAAQPSPGAAAFSLPGTPTDGLTGRQRVAPSARDGGRGCRPPVANPERCGTAAVLQRLYGWAMAKAAHPHAFWWLVAFAFAEATFFPLPADVLLIPMVLAMRARAWRLAAVCTVASVAGGCFGWLIGTFAFEELGRPLLELYGAMDQMAVLRAEYQKYGELFVAIGAVTPVPYKVVTIASGFFQMDPASFTLVSLIGRGVRYFAVAGAVYLFGPLIERFINRNVKLAFAVFTVLLLGGFVLVAWVL